MEEEESLIEKGGQKQERIARDSNIGVTFSGGGIRSAAFSSGVLRRILQKSLKIDYLSCVSGGGYTGTAYLDWKYRHGGQDDPEWHERFFNKMRKNSGTLCIWRNPIKGFVDSIVILLLILIIGIIFPFMIWIPVALPAAYLIDYVFGEMLRSGFICPDALNNGASTNITPGIERLRNLTSNMECVPYPDESIWYTYILFVSLGAAAMLFFGAAKIVSNTWEPRFSMLAFISVFLFAFTFLPWFIEQYISVTPIWANAVIVAVGIVLWMGLPPLRDKASWALLVYFYCYVIKWRVYKTPVFKMSYSNQYFLYALWISAGLFWISPFLSNFQQGCIHAFYRCKLQNAFYTNESSGWFGCRGISCRDFLPICVCSDILDRPTLMDLKDIKPQYICNVLVDTWIYENHDMATEKSYTLLTLSPTLIERIDDDDVPDFDEHFIGPEDVRLSDAMATSAAVLSYHMGEYMDKGALSLQVLLGLTMGKSWISDKRYYEKNCWGRVAPFLIQVVLGIPLLLISLCSFLLPLRFCTHAFNHVTIGCFIGLLGVFTIIALLPTGKSKSSLTERLARWCIVNIYQVRYIREMMKVNNIGTVPPAVLHLSDGGHIENLGILPLLKKRLKRILVVDGGYCEKDEDAGYDLLLSLKLARTKLRCSFSGMDGRDIYEDIRDKLIETQPGRQPRNYRFKVQYYEKQDGTSHCQKVGEGEILLLLPRHPRNGLPPKCLDWEEYYQDTNMKLKSSRWGRAPSLEGEEVDKLTFCCSECCHSPCYSCCSDPLCGHFPRHKTGNQFFTSEMFSAYHREGYIAATEGVIESFLAGQGQ